MSNKFNSCRIVFKPNPNFRESQRAAKHQIKTRLFLGIHHKNSPSIEIGGLFNIYVIIRITLLMLV
jgi:hypothetical protein